MKSYEILGLTERPAYRQGLGYGPGSLQSRELNDCTLLDELLYLRDGATAGYLALLTGLDGRYASGALRRLERKGITEKAPESRDIRDAENRDLRGLRTATGRRNSRGPLYRLTLKARGGD